MPKTKHPGGRPLGARDSHPRKANVAGTLKSFRADKTTVQQLETMAAQDGDSQTAVILNAIHHYFEYNKALNAPAGSRVPFPTVSMALPGKSFTGTITGTITGKALTGTITMQENRPSFLSIKKEAELRL